MQWIVDGAMMFLRNGGRLQVPEAVAEETEGYRESEDWLQNFLDECCALDSSARMPSRTLYTAYKDYAISSGEYCRRERDFVAAMEAKGFRRIKPRNIKTWLGVSLVNQINSIYGQSYNSRSYTGA